MEMNFFNDLIADLEAAGLAEQLKGYSPEEMAELEEALPEGKALSDSVREWLLIGGNFSPHFKAEFSFRRLIQVFKGGIYDMFEPCLFDEYAKVRDNWFVFSVARTVGNEGVFEHQTMLMTAYNEVDPPVLFPDFLDQGSLEVTPMEEDGEPHAAHFSTWVATEVRTFGVNLLS